MQNITISVNKLMDIVKENKIKHDYIFDTAVSGYWVKAEEVLKGKLAQVQKKEEINNYLNLSYPSNHSDDYERVIRMLELTTDDKVNLTAKEFDNYVRNQWDWRNAFLLNYSGYTATTGSLAPNF
jgi:hypothetical protein